MGGKDDGRRRRRRRGNGSPRRDEPGRNVQAESAANFRDRNRPGGEVSASGGRRANAGKSGIPRLKWTPPELSAEPLPEPDCFYCGKPIRDIGAAIQDKGSGQPVHFDCVLARLSGSEMLETGDAISYIGGGRFGVVHFNERFGEGYAGSRNRPFPVYAGEGRRENDAPGRVFTIKKIFEWENKEERPDWRAGIADHYSIT